MHRMAWRGRVLLCMLASGCATPNMPAPSRVSGSWINGYANGRVAGLRKIDLSGAKIASDAARPAAPMRRSLPYASAQSMSAAFTP